MHEDHVKDEKNGKYWAAKKRHFSVRQGVCMSYASTQEAEQADLNHFKRVS